MIPQRRFATLLDQAREYQQERCLYHNAPTNARTFSLYADHLCDADAFPQVTTAILQGHDDEVWNLQWSHSGSYLATAGKDKSAIIWRIGVSCCITSGKVATNGVTATVYSRKQIQQRESIPHSLSCENTGIKWAVWHGRWTTLCCSRRQRTSSRCGTQECVPWARYACCIDTALLSPVLVFAY